MPAAAVDLGQGSETLVLQSLNLADLHFCNFQVSISTRHNTTTPITYEAYPILISNLPGLGSCHLNGDASAG